MSDFDLSSYLSAFLDELDEQLQILDEKVLDLEQDSSNLDTIQAIFRAAHTLKGSSAAMGFEKMKELTHKVENVFDLIRNQQLQVNTNIINVIFESIDFIKVLKDGIISGSLEEIEISPVVEKLENIKNGTTTVEVEKENNVELDPKEHSKTPNSTSNGVNPTLNLDLSQIEKMKEAIYSGLNVISVHVSLNPEALLKSVRAFLIQNNLLEVSELIGSFPENEVIENDENFDGQLTYIIVTNSANEEINSIVNSIADIQSVQLTNISEDSLNEFLCNDDKTATKNESTGQETSASNEQKVQNGSGAKPETNGKTEGNKFKVQQTVRVDVERLEHLMNLVGELVIDQTRLADVRNRLADRYQNDPEIEQFSEVGNHIGQVISELQEGMMKTRMLPIEQLFNRFPRMVRDLCQKAGKEIDFNIEGKETELDRNLIEEIGDPIIHLLRNSLDHGVEEPEERERLGKPRKGRVTLKASHEENHIVITITDDGRGIDPEKVKATALKKGYVTEEDVERMTDKDLIFLIFKSGVSTAKQITDISGRGVGMDIVRSHIEKLNGMVDIDSKLGEGTTFTIKLPLTLAIIRSLLVELGDREFAIPLANVQEIVRLNKDEVKSIKNQEVGIIRDRVLPLIRMHSRLGAQENNLNEKKRLFVVVVGLAEKRVGIVVDRTLGNQEIVIKPLGKYIGQPKYIAGATIMGDGSVALILDIGSIVREEGTKELGNQEYDHKEISSEDEVIQLATFKLGAEEYGVEIDRVKDIITVPEITKVINAPYSVLGMINLRGRLIPVMDLRQRFDIVQQELDRKSRIMVVEFANQLVGILVDQVTQVIKVPVRTIEAPPDNTSQVDAKFIKNISNLNDRLIILLDLDLILDIQELKLLTNIVEETKQQLVEI
ncbi:chemotaxis protein CheW [Calidifontibacillus oryziterrae]|uniref:chemotaxis protein CheW n=1 Tax=Calidifontibacillus oryziterrae TaxID=1191699 RepID=UPI0002F88D25